MNGKEWTGSPVAEPPDILMMMHSSVPAAGSPLKSTGPARKSFTCGDEP